jgi:hypothetical protein
MTNPDRHSSKDLGMLEFLLALEPSQSSAAHREHWHSEEGMLTIAVELRGIEVQTKKRLENKVIPKLSQERVTRL